MSNKLTELLQVSKLESEELEDTSQSLPEATPYDREDFLSPEDAAYANFLHPLDRPGQQEALDFIINSDKKVIIIDAPTGLGKSALSAHLSKQATVLALTKEKSLQDDNYKGSYRFRVLKGKGNYPCAYDSSFTAESCGIDHNKQMKDAALPNNVLHATHCVVGNCAYKTAKALMKGSSRGCLNYTKFLLEPNESWNEPDYIFCDEAHHLPDLVLEFSSFTIDWNNKFLGGMSPIPFTGAIPGMSIMELIGETLKANEPDEERDPKSHIQWNRISHRFDTCMGLLSLSKANDELGSWFAVSTSEKIVIKPLTAKYNFKRMFYSRATQLVFTSATIGRWVVAALGISPTDVAYLKVPHPYPVEDRPVYVMENMPKMSWTNTGRFCEKTPEITRQAFAIKTIAEKRPDTSLVVLTNSSNHAWGILKNLQKMGYNNAFISQEEGTEKKILEWSHKRKPGAICISYSFWEGVNLQYDQTIIVAKIPFPPMGQPGSFERTKMEYDPQLWRTYCAIKLTQGMGRNRRGSPDHYGLDELGRAKKNVFIIDGALSKIKSALSEDTQESLVSVAMTNEGFKLSKG